MSSEDWRLQALCRGEDTDAYFSRSRGNQSTKVAAMCAACPVIQPCRTHGIAFEFYGVWGGMTVTARKAERRRLGITLETPGEHFDWGGSLPTEQVPA